MQRNPRRATLLALLVCVTMLLMLQMAGVLDAGRDLLFESGYPRWIANAIFGGLVGLAGGITIRVAKAF